jgi:glucose-1-phosphate thymidylyltransferase
MKALILAAGYATRLYPLTRKYPKPLLQVGGRPIIDYVVDKLSALEEVKEIIVVTNSKFIGLFRRWAKGLRLRPALTLVDDRTRSLADRLGAIGDMHFVVRERRVNDDLLVAGGDNLFDGGLRGFAGYCREKNHYPVIGLYDIKDKARAVHYGVVKLGPGGRIAGFQEKPRRPASSLVAMCLYFFPRAKLGLIEEYASGRGRKKDATGLYISWLRRKTPVYGYAFSGRWYDIGDHKFYEEAQEKFS